MTSGSQQKILQEIIPNSKQVYPPEYGFCQKYFNDLLYRFFNTCNARKIKVSVKRFMLKVVLKSY